MRPERDKNEKFTAEEWKQILASMENEDPVELLEVSGENVVAALREQWPSLLTAWRAYDRAEADYLYFQGSLNMYIQHLEDQ